VPIESPEFDLSVIHETAANTSSEPDDRTRLELAEFEAESKRLDLVDKQQDIEARKKYANKIFTLISVWLGCMLVVILLAGFGSKCEWFKMADSVLIALITTTTGSVIGLFAIVANYLFKNK
jgi:hypothetical protein